jgi:tRNA dimethylallyltransferase
VPAGASYSTGDWLREATGVVADLRARGRLPIFVGGTGLYFKALTGGLDDMPAIPDAIRTRLRERLVAEGPETLHRELKSRDPTMAARLGGQDGQRIVRALEVLEATGRSIADFQGRGGPVVVDPARAKKIVKLPDRALLHQRINRRFEAMFDEGAVAEVEALLRLGLSPEMPAMKAIGVSQIAAMLRGEMTPEQVVEQASAATRQYAKRQMTGSATRWTKAGRGSAERRSYSRARRMRPRAEEPGRRPSLEASSRGCLCQAIRPRPSRVAGAHTSGGALDEVSADRAVC